MAQLQLGLFGMDEEFMEETNKQIRDAISGQMVLVLLIWLDLFSI